MLENMVVVPLCWLTRENRQFFIQMEYEVIPIPGYQETNGYRAFKIIGKYSGDIWWINNSSVPIWEDWKLTAEYACRVQILDTTVGIQMFDHMDDDEKIKTLRYYWYPVTMEHVVKYFQEHLDLLTRASHIHSCFKEKPYFDISTSI